MVNKYLEQLKKKKRYIVNYSTPKEGVEELLKISPNVKKGYIGSFSISSSDIKIYKIEKPSLIINGIELIGTEISKYLILLNSKSQGYRRKTLEILETTPPPLFAKPGTYENYIYVDIKSCYFSLLTKLWGIKYCRGEYLGFSKNTEFFIPPEFMPILQEYKEIRNALYGMLRVRTRTKFIVNNDNIDFKIEKSKNNLLYPDIPLGIMDITQAIATIAIKDFGCVYVAIDGFIIPQKHLINFIEFLQGLGLKTGVKAEGEAIIKNYYTYQIGKIETKNYKQIETAKEIKTNLIFNPKEAKEIINKFKPFLSKNI